MLRVREENKSQGKQSTISTESESCSQRQEDLIQLLNKKQKVKKDKSKYKTELCKNFSFNGYCPYGKKCRFAHGPHELMSVSVNDYFRTKKCNGFWENGYCHYGVRCQFAHHQEEWESKVVLLVVNCILEKSINNSKISLGKLMSLLQTNQ